jgi:hypothetical protein
LNPSSASPVAPITSLVDHTSADDFGPSTTTSDHHDTGLLPGIPRISLDMPPMQPTPAKSARPLGHSHHLEQHDEGDHDERPTYARLDSEA